MIEYLKQVRRLVNISIIIFMIFSDVSTAAVGREIFIFLNV